jgi:DNA-binding Lrp family transcriptional regulator
MSIMIFLCIVLRSASVNEKVSMKVVSGGAGSNKNPGQIAIGSADQMDDLDRRIIKELQGNFPLEIHPYEIMAENLGMSTDQLWQRVLALAESGVIRRMGFSIDSRKIGYSSTLAAVKVTQDRVGEASELIASYPQITHSYLREDIYNIWFTVIAENRDAVLAILEDIRQKLKLSEEDVMDLPVEKLYKLDARFK